MSEYRNDLYQTEELKTINFKHRKKEGENPPILVCDSICGSGKTQAAIEYINGSPPWNENKNPKT